MTSNNQSTKESSGNLPVAEPLIESFIVGNSHAVTVIVDQKKGSEAYNTAPREDGTSNILFGGRRKPVNMDMCPHCSKKNARTSTRTHPNGVTWAGVVVGAVVFFPICWVPLVMDSMKQTDHFCQSCGAKIGTIKPLEGCCVKERF